MCKEPKFYVCKVCGNFVSMIHDSGVNMVCCGEDMTEVEVHTADKTTEKHVPVITVDGNTVKVVVGTTLHPMLKEHHIEWIVLHTEEGMQRKCLAVDGPPSIEFALTPDDKVISAYEYCNIHGLWKGSL